MSEEPFTTPMYVFTPTVRPGEWIRSRRTLMSIVLALADFIAFFAGWYLALVLRFYTVGQPIPPIYNTYAILAPLVVLVNALSGLYTHNLSEVEEFRRLSKATTLYFVFASALLYLSKEGAIVSRLAIFYAWVICLALVPILRESIRSVLVKMGYWGEPVVIFGNGRLGNEVSAHLRANPKMGYNPVGVVDRRKVTRDDCGDDHIIHDAEVFSQRNTIPDWMQGVRTAFIVTPETSDNMREMLIGKQTIRFEQIIMVRSSERVGSLWVQPIDIGGILGLEVGQNLLNRNQLAIKRILDLTLIVIFLPLLLVVFALVSLLIKLDSRGSIFYHQSRIGYGGKPFKFWKFRSMYDGADKVLEDYLASNPDRKTEYDKNHKLKNDPRITHVGKIIRKLSIDELPQLFNVIKGEMSLVGPRPFMSNEINFYEKCFSLYTYVLPGVTGLWQISGRSNVTYTTRVSLDEYYLRNWSIWLDLHILVKTIGVVLRGRGSY